MQRHPGPTPAELAHTFGFFASIKTLALSGYNKAGNDHWIRTEDYFSFLFPHSPPPQEIVKYFSHYHSWICLYTDCDLPALLLGLLASQ